MKNLIRFVAPLAAFVTMTAPAYASSLPKADFSRNNLGLGIGNGLSVSLDFPLSRDLSLGGAVNLGYLYARTSSLDVRLLYKILHAGRERLGLDILAGVQGWGYNFALGGWEPFAGVALAYPFTPQLTGRLNLAVGLLGGFTGAPWGAFGPSGLEIGYRFTPSLEGTLGANGRGDVLGLNFSF